MTKKCICQICTCGRHKCPHYPRGGQISVEPCTISEYSNKYQAHALEATKNFKPDAQPIQSGAPLDDKTTMRVDYVQHPLERPYHHQPDKYEKPCGEFDMTTNYNVEFNKKPLEVVKMIRPSESRKVHGRFDGVPTYTTDYRKWDTQPRGQYGPGDTYQPSGVPFDGDTNYNREFIKHNATMRESCKPQERPLNTGAFDDATDYKQSYVRHNLPEKFAKEKVTWEANCQPFDDQSNYKTDFTKKQGCGQLASFKPDNKAYTSTAPFDGVTTQNVDYKQWPLEQQKRREPEAYRKPEGGMSMDTTTNTDYNRKYGEVAKLIRPTENRRVHGQFDGTTNYQVEFKPWVADRVRPMPKDGYMPNEAPFEGMPMYQTDYVRHTQEMTKSLKPEGGNYRPTAPLDDHTEYRDEYFKKRVDICPAIPLQTNAKNEFVQDDAGHKWYNVNNGIPAN